ncbi:MAG: sigma-54-dependent Fis family transcriptional regulator, partial [Gammaproteobacteria bacterium]|nr:sigma-54-dependent Fis family transcriptional regulator [Gammaproteobacteria bacterium]
MTSDETMPASGSSTASAATDVYILIVEDEAVLAKAIAKRFRKEGYVSDVAGTLAAAREQIARATPDLILLDMRLPDGSGLDFLEQLRERDSADIPVVVMTAYGELEDAVAALKLKALDYLKKPVDLDELLLIVEKVFRQVAVRRSLDYSRQRDGRGLDSATLLGESDAIVQLRKQIQRIGAITANATASPPTVHILGETGSGKDLAAKLLHLASSRRERPFVHVDCAALPKDLIEAELFGHEKGAYTGAHTARTGLVVAAEDGTVFLNEIAELPLELQSKLLTVLERRTVRQVGSSRERRVPAWFIAATNRNLEEMVKQERFRSDLFYRLKVLTLTMPPLRERGDDVILLARHFAKQTAQRYGLPQPELAQVLIAALRGYAWPGNVRELQHLVERAVLLSDGRRLTRAAMSLESSAADDREQPETAEALKDMTLEAAEYQLIRHALDRADGNVSEAARRLGVTRMALRYRMQKY